jgi:hypothetical protein
MADKSLKPLVGSIQAEDAEMERYRARLAPLLHKPERLRRLYPLGIAATAAVALLVLLAVPRPIQFSKLTLDQVHALAANRSPDAIEKAREAAQIGEGDARWNATMFLCLTENLDRAMDYAIRGIRQDPRPQFRLAYIEFLLDNTDGHRLSTGEIERLMDREYDSTCLYLFRELFRVTRLQERYLGPTADQGENGLKDLKI